MDLLKRIGFYLIGIAIGSIIVFFIWDKKKTTFCYLPNCRILKDIRLKKRAFDPAVQQLVDNKELDTAAISFTYVNGDVIFSKSNTKVKSCKTYFIESEYNKKSYEFLVENCDSIAMIKKVVIK